MKIVYVIDHLRPDGTQQFLRLLAGELGARGHQQAVVCLNDAPDAALVGALRAAGAEVRVVGRRGLLGGAGLLTTWVWLRSRRFDTAVTMLLYSDVIGRPLARAAGVPRIIGSIRSTNVQYSALQRRLVRASARWCDQFVLNSAHAREFAARVEGADAARTVVITNGVDLRRHASVRPAAIRERLGIPAGARLIGGVGRLSAEKGYDTLLEALALLGQADVQLVLAGEGPEEPRLRELAARLGVAERVCFAGRRDDVSELLAALDVFAHPARWEGMSNAVLEAMAAARPIVASAIPGNAELLDATCGWLVAPGDPRALAEAIGAALEQPDEARRRGAAARLRVEERYSVAAMADAWERALGCTHIPAIC